MAEFDLNGNRVGGFVPDLGPTPIGVPDEAWAVAPDLQGGVWLSAWSSSRVRHFDAAGNVLATFNAATGGIPVRSLKVIDYDAPLGTDTCAGVVNSTGNAGALATTGEVAVIAGSLTLTASDLPVGSTALFLTSRSFALIPIPGGSQGDLCLGAPIGRFVGPGQVQPVGASGVAALSVDTTALPTPTGLVALASGDTWHFQCWYRDVVGGAAASNFTGARSVTFP